MRRAFLFALLVVACSARFVTDGKRPLAPPVPVPPVETILMRPYLNDSKCSEWADSVMQRLSLKERVAQLFIYTIAPQRDKRNRELLRKVVGGYKVGGLLFSGGLLQNQAMLTNEAQQMADVPLLITADAEWGLSMRLQGTPAFPRNMVLGCIEDDSLVYEYGREMARQCKELGIQVNFAPVADVNINPQNPVINTRSFGEDPVRVSNKVLAYSKGLEEGGVLSVCKHFPGHGDTDVDSHKALPTLSFTRERLDSVELYPFKQAISAGLSGIMVGHLEVPVFETRSGLPSSLSRNVVYDLLTHELKFKGLIFTDALAMKGVSGNSSVCLQALKAGNDLLLVPRRIKEELESVVEAVRSGELAEEYINEKCRKVLMYKYALGLSRRPHVRLTGLENRINTPATQTLIKRLNLAAITVLGNQTGVLPLDPVVKDVAVLNVGDAKTVAPFLKELSRYTHPVVHQLGENLPEVEYGQLRDSLVHYKRILVCITEQKLAAYQAFFAKFAPEVPVVYLSFIPGKQLLQIHRGISAAEAVVLAHSADEEVQQQVAGVLYGDVRADGRLSAAIGGLFAAGMGEVLGPHSVPRFVPEEYGMDSRLLAKIDEIAEEGIREGAYPGCQVVILKDGREMYNKAFGTHTRGGVATNSPQQVQKTDVYDIASLSKTTATLLAVMKLYDKGRISLTDCVADYLPFLRNTDKKDITVRDLLLHESGLPSTLLFYQDAIDPKSYSGSLFRGKQDARHPLRIGSRTWANPKFRFRAGLTSKVQTTECTMQVADSLWLNRSFKEEYLQKIADAPLKRKAYRYSCVGFILLQQLVEARTGMALSEFLAKEFYMPMGLKHTGYLPLRFLNKDEIVPSSIDPFLRKTTLQGFVHDESAAFLGGVSGNAGLFSNAGEVAKIHQMLLNGGELDGKRYLSKATCRLFTTTVSKISRRGLGFDKPDTRNPQNSPCAESAPASVYGHTGFTGTCAWADPENNLVYVFLCNRIYPNVWNNKLMQLNIRTRIQEAMYKAMLPRAPEEGSVQQL